MNSLLNYFVDAGVQCWGCPVFDQLFIIISGAAAAVYRHFIIFCAVLFCVLVAFILLRLVWTNIKGGVTDPFYQKSLKPLIINSLVVFAFMGMGVGLPRFMTTVTFEPVAKITLIYTQSMLQTDNETVNEKVSYQPENMPDNGFFRPQLRDTVIQIMKTTITQFQAYMKLGIAVMEHALTWKMLLGIGSLIKHLILLFIGAYLFYGFFKLFIKFCFYFADLIVALTFFAFFFPLSLVLAAFNGVDVPEWIKGLGKGVGTNQTKKVIGAIVGLGATVITYTVIMAIIAKFFVASDANGADLMELIIKGQIFEADLNDENLAALTLGSSVVLIYVLNFIYDQIPQVTKMILGAFDVSSETQLGEQLAKDAGTFTQGAINLAKKIGGTIVSPKGGTTAP